MAAMAVSSQPTWLDARLKAGNDWEMPARTLLKAAVTDMCRAVHKALGEALPEPSLLNLYDATAKIAWSRYSDLSILACSFDDIDVVLSVECDRCGDHQEFNWPQEADDAVAHIVAVLRRPVK